MVSADGKRRVRPIKVDGKALLRVEAKGKEGRWYFLAETPSIAEVAQHVDISTLEPAG